MDDTYLLPFLDHVRQSEFTYNLDEITHAVQFAAQKHTGQQRKSGEPYIIHPIAVAEILISYGLDDATIVAALLHDVLEDTETTADELTKEFGDTVTELVEGVTKLNQISYISQEKQQIENLRKMLLAMAKDIRVILIKLADRLHNMRTLEYQNSDKQLQKARETLEIYAPLAHRLGIQSMKKELEDTALRYLDPVGYQEIVDNLETFKENNERFPKILELIKDRLKKEGIEASIESRAKHVYSIYRKMYTQNKEFSEIYDLYAFRIIVDKTTECYQVLGLMHDMFTAIPGRLKDYIATPKPNMYQSLHTTVSYEGYLFEIQIRTYEMHKVAELGIAAHWKYKSGIQGSDPLDGRLEWIRKLLDVQNNVSDDDFYKTFKIDLFADQVFVSTPKGDIITLHADSTVIDFAYAIHSAVGNKMIGAKINGRIVDFSSSMQNGDVVEIITSNASQGPSRDWLNLCKTNEAKAKIRAWFKKEKREENIQQGKADLERELRVNLINLENVDPKELFDPTLKRLGFEDMDEFYAAIGYGGITIAKILPKLKDDYQKLTRKEESPLLAPSVKKTRKKPVNGIVVDDIDNCLIKIAGCCVPVPGDSIIGFITRGSGVSVHRSDCPHMLNVDTSRFVKVHWEQADTEYFTAHLSIDAANRFDLLSDLSSTLASLHIMTKGFSMVPLQDGNVRVLLSIDVHSAEHLSFISKSIQKLKNIHEVKRSYQ